MDTLFVAGGSSGIGEAIITKAMPHFRRVVMTYHSNAEKAERIRERAKTNGVELITLQCDLSRRDSVAQLCLAIDEFAADVSKVVHAAGISYDMLYELVDIEKARGVFDLNFWSVFEINQHLLSRLRRNKNDPRIVVISSVVAIRPNVGNLVYAASKASLDSYVRSLALEMARYRLTVNSVNPGFVDTDMIDRARLASAVKSVVPLRRMASPEEVASLVLFLMSPGAGSITGQNIVLDGGLSVQLASGV